MFSPRRATRPHGPRAVLDAGRPLATERLKIATAVVEPPAQDERVRRQTVADIRRGRLRGLPVDGRVRSGRPRRLHQPSAPVARVTKRLFLTGPPEPRNAFVQHFVNNFVRSLSISYCDVFIMINDTDLAEEDGGGVEEI